MMNNIDSALAWGVPIVNLWTFYDNTCRLMYPSAKDQKNRCDGYWMIKPDGSLSQQYTLLKEKYELHSGPEVNANRSLLNGIRNLLLR
jgi:hypothetical protein